MAKKIIWSSHAIAERKHILGYWIIRNGSKTYSIKLNRLFREAATLISEYPHIGKPTDMQGVRAKRVRDYYIFYETTEENIYILTLWDTRQEPEELEKTLKNILKGR